MAPRAKSFAEALEITAEVYRAAGRLMAERGLLQGVADEGGWWPAFSTNEEALDMLVRAIETGRLRAGRGGGDLARRRGIRIRPRGPLPAGPRRARARPRRPGRILLLGWCERYPILSIEDPLAEDDPIGLASVHGRGRRPGPGHRRRFPGHQRGTGRGGGPRRHRQRRAGQGQPGRHRDAKPRPPARRDNGPGSAPSCRRARAKPRTSPSPIWRSAGAPASSRSARSPAPSGWPNGTRSCASRKRSAAAPVLRGRAACLHAVAAPGPHLSAGRPGSERSSLKSSIAPRGSPYIGTRGTAKRPRLRET